MTPLHPNDPHPTTTTFGGVLTQEDIEKLREIHGWLSELMPAARIAVRMMNARHNLMSRWLKRDNRVPSED